MKSNMIRGAIVTAALMVSQVATVSAAEVPENARTAGCMACHAVDNKVVGPSWRDVAQRYQGESGAREALIEKVKKGGTGNWTDVTGGVPMPPNSPRVSDEVIAELVDFVLSLE